MNNLFKTNTRLLCLCLIAFLCVSFCLVMQLPVFVQAADGEASLSGVPGLVASWEDQSYNRQDYPAAAWTVESNGLKWSGKTERTGNFITGYKYNYRATKLVLTNTTDTGKTLELYYTVTLDGGTVKIGTMDVKSNATNALFSAYLPAGESLIIAVSSSTSARNKTTSVTLSTINWVTNDVTMTFKAADSAKGTYTVNGSHITSDTSMKGPASNAYSIRAIPADNYIFSGWYLDGQLYSTNIALDAGFSADGVITAEFVVDPLYQATTANGNLKKDQLVTINTQYYHDPKSSLNLKQSGNKSECYYSVVASTGIHDDWDMQYVPFLSWAATSGGITASHDGNAGGEWCTSATNSYIRVNMVSNVIRIYAKETCDIRFDYTNSLSIGGLLYGDKTNEAYLRIYESSKANETYSTIESKGTVYTDTNKTIEIKYTLQKGQYLYIYTSGYMHCNQLQDNNAAVASYSYSAKITGFEVSYNDNQCSIVATIEDNAGNGLQGGKLTVGTTAYTSDANGNIGDLTLAIGQSLSLTATAPKNYRLLGWEVDGELYIQTKYTWTIEADTVIKVIFVPDAVTITYGQGADPIYQYKNTSGSLVAFDGQYVARNASADDFYTTLEEAFSKTSVVVLLGNVTIVGNYTIESGKVLVVPSNLTDVEQTDSNAMYVPMVYLSSEPPLNPITSATLTITGQLTVKDKGILLVSGFQNPATGAPYGSASGVLTVSGTVTLNNGSALYGYGKVNGTGVIYAKSGSKVHELCEVLDKPHPQVMWGMTQKAEDYRILPFNVFYVNTIEAKTIYSTGSTLDCHFALQYDEVTQSSLCLLGPSNSIFVLKKGTVSKYYDRDSHQIVVQVDAGAESETGSVEIPMHVSFSGTPYDANLNSGDYVLPLSCGFYVRIEGSLSLNHHIKLLPGAKIDVTSTGKLTISDSGALILYRLNDYDYRRIATGGEPTGFSVAGYPLNITRSGYAFKINEIGSAKLNVDGKLYANGGLYVTNTLIEEYTAPEDDPESVYRNYTRYDNGYNVLTGTGMIDMGTRANPLSYIYENLAYGQDKNLHAVQVALVPMKGIQDKDATEDVPEIYTQLSNVVYGLLNSNGLYVWTSADCDGWNGSYIATNVELGNNLNLYFAFNHKELNASSGHYIRINGGAPIYIGDWDYADSNADGVVDYYVVIYRELAAKQMTDTVFVALYRADGVAIDCWSDSIRDYAHRLLTKYAEEENKSQLRTLLVDMLNYGAACQIHFKYNEGDLANSKLDDTQKGYGTQGDFDWSDNLSDPTKDSNGNTNPYFDGVNLVTDGNIQFAIKFKGSFKSFTYSFANHWNDEDSKDSNLNKGPAINVTVDYDSSANYYYISDLVVGDARQVITFTVGDVTWTDSIEAYCHRMYHRDGATATEKTVFEAFMKFSDAAEAYLEGGNRV